MEEWVEKAVKAGGKVLVGGKRDGVLFDATILEDVPFECEVVSEEIFGPILVISKYSDFKDAIKQANESRYGLQAGVFTNDLNKAFYAYEKLQVRAGAVSPSFLSFCRLILLAPWIRWFSRRQRTLWTRFRS